MESYLNEILVGMLAGAGIVRHNRIATETARRQAQDAHEAHVREQERLGRQAPIDAFIESKADEFAKLEKILSFQEYISKNQSAMTSTEHDAILKAVNDLATRLQSSLSLEALGRAVNVSD